MWLCRFRVRETKLNQVKASKKEIYGSRAGGPATGSNGDKWSESMQAMFEHSL